ncbi:hypothetical protein AVEN_75572-1 [Araneus ventricosus]|uniref:DUF19 domain-containing protein n=1 Tax=Araneus ventricosus TaxID=182803 RepID=A0A4Y2CJL2_ARAVE|nr:hypothetical protein AVEN_75572-1 [Araneus ventricosus]
MMLFIFVLSCMIAGSLACSDARCKDPVLANELLQVSFLPNKEELRTLCPKVMTFLECERDFMECPGQSLDELATSTDKLEAAKAKGMLAGIGLVRDMCDEDSSFHTDYVASVSCYREHLIGAAGKCRDDIAKPIEEFFYQYHADDDEDDVYEVIFKELRCLRDAYEVACVIGSLGEACGDVAQRTARNVAERLKDVLGINSCKTLQNAADLKSRFLDFLELDEQRRSDIEGIFDLFKRRR